MTSDEFKAAVATDLQEIFARNPDISQREISGAIGLSRPTLNKYLNHTDFTTNMPLGTYLHLIQELGRRDAIKRNHPTFRVLQGFHDSNTRYFDSPVRGRRDILLFDYLRMMADRDQPDARNLLKYYERRVPA